MAKPLSQTKEITNFTGRLTRIVNGDLNSGFAKFTTSWGYDPFSKPLNLTWLYQPTDIAGSVVTDAILSAQLLSNNAIGRYVYAIGNSGNLYKIDPTRTESAVNPLYDTPSLIGSTSTVSGSFAYGADLEYFNGGLQITSDSKLVTANLLGSVTAVQSVTGALYHPQVQFLGKDYIANGNNIMEMDSTGLITNGAKLSPSLPTGTYILDLDVTPDGNYMIITASNLYPTDISSPQNITDASNAYAVDSTQYFWNGTDQGVTQTQILPSFPASALQTVLNKRYFFLNDAFGAALFEGSGKDVTLPQNQAPMPDAVTSNGTYLTWAASEGTGSVTSANSGFASTFSSLYYYGSLDAENPSGLWRFLRISPSTDNVVWRAPVNMMVNNFFFSRNVVRGWGKHYISTFEYNSGTSSNTYHLYRFVLPPSANTSPVLGVYETQNQLFSKRIGISQIRVYTEPVVSGNGFQLDIIGPDGNPMANGTFTWTYGDPADKDQRINFNPGVATMYSFGIRLTNTGTTNMTILKVEIDYSEEGK